MALRPLLVAVTDGEDDDDVEESMISCILQIIIIPIASTAATYCPSGENVTDLTAPCNPERRCFVIAGVNDDGDEEDDDDEVEQVEAERDPSSSLDDDDEHGDGGMTLNQSWTKP